MGVASQPSLSTDDSLKSSLSLHQAACAALTSQDLIERIKAVRFIKNAIIGNRTKKQLYLMKLNIGPKLVSYFTSSSFQNDVELKIQAAVVLGSFAYGDEENIGCLIQAGAVQTLLSSLVSPYTMDVRLIEAVARTLRALYQSSKVNRSEFHHAAHIKAMVQLLNPQILTPNVNALPQSQLIPLRISEVIASLLARVISSSREQKLFLEAGVLQALLGLISVKYNGYPKVQEAALDALAACCKENPDVAQMLISLQGKDFAFMDMTNVVGDDGETSICAIHRLLKDRRPTMRLLAATCMTHLSKCSLTPPPLSQDTTLSVMLTLVRLFQDNNILSTVSPNITVREKSPLVFAYLVIDREDLQKAAMEADAIHILTAVIHDVSARVFSYAETKTTMSISTANDHVTPDMGYTEDGLPGKRGTDACTHPERILEASY